MSNSVILSLGVGNLKDGFANITAELRVDGNAPSSKIQGSLPATPALENILRRWQLLYSLSLSELGWPLRQIEIESEDITQYSDVEFATVNNELKTQFKNWLESEGFNRVDKKLRTDLKKNDEIRVIIETEDTQVQLLPWHLWDFFDAYQKAEWALSAIEYGRVQSHSQTPSGEVRILAILGNDGGIDLQTDTKLIQDLKKHGANPFFLTKPSRKAFIDCLRDEAGWDIIFFAGHSETDEGRGRIHISPTDSLTINEFQNAMKRAIQQGVQLAIFNSCEGLGLAKQLASLNIPQMIVMRAPVPDRIAQNFLEYFLHELANNKSIYLSVRYAREQLAEKDNVDQDYSWLPAIYQNPTIVPQDWKQLLNKAEVMPQPKILEPLLGRRYGIIRKLGEGSFGKTYLAKDTKFANALCLVKELNPQNADISTAKRLFRLEAKTLQKLNPNSQIPKLIDYLESDQQGKYYLVEEYIKGHPLDQILQGQVYNESSITFFLQDILSILKDIHKLNIIHRDVKPSNIIKRQDSKFILIDFGAVKHINNQGAKSQQQTNSTIAIGTRGYAAPEQLAGNPCLNSDIYALGMTAIQALTGIHPNQLRRDGKDNIILPKSIQLNKPLMDILNKMVRSNPQKRYQEATQVIEDICRINSADKSTIVKSSSHQSSLAYVNRKNNNDQTIKISKMILSRRHLFVTLILIAIGLCTEFFIYPFIRPWYHWHKGERLLDLYKPEAALEQFDNIIDITGDSVIKRNSAKAWQGRADALFSLGRYDGANKSYDLAIKYQKDNLDSKILNRKGNTLYKLEDYKAALATHQQVLNEIDSNNAEAWGGKGLAQLGLKEYENALYSFNKAQDIKPKTPTLWLLKGMALQYLKKDDEAQKFYQETLAIYKNILQRKSNDPISWTDQGTVLLQLTSPDFQAALKSYEEALNIAPDFYEALVGKANALSLLGNFKDALKVSTQAIVVRPKDHQMWYLRGELLAREEKNYKEALKCFEEAIGLRNKFSPAWIGKGDALTKLERYNDALVAFDQAKAIEPNNPWIWDTRAKVLEKLNRNAEALNSYNKAIEMYNKAIETHPGYQHEYQDALNEAIKYRNNLKKKLGR